MFKGLLALVDDLAVLSRAAASSLDDVAALTGKAGSKAAGIVVDDAAVTPGYVVGLSADRELKVIWKIAVGSLRNKLLVLLPAALALSYFAPWAIMPLLICGGFFLCFEGAEKILKKVRPKAVADDETSPEAADPVALENARVKGAITTDFILSAEIMAITLTTVNKETSAIGMRAAVLAAVAVMITVAVYGAVAIIVKADEAGMWLARSKLAFKRALGRAIVRDPQVFLFDEPLSNLDAKLRVQMRTEIKALHQRLKTTSIYVTHDQIEAMTMADRIVVMRDGVVEQIGTPLQLYDNPANVFVAGFIGSPAMNLIKGRWVGGAVQVGEARVPVRRPMRASDGQSVLLGMRPEHLTPSDASPLTARVEVIEPTGSDTLVMCTLGGEPLTVVLRDRMALKPGMTLRLAPSFDALHVFDEANGKSLAS